jgi:hypothetical protein
VASDAQQATKHGARKLDIDPHFGVETAGDAGLPVACRDETATAILGLASRATCLASVDLVHWTIHYYGPSSAADAADIQ